MICERIMSRSYLRAHHRDTEAQRHRGIYYYLKSLIFFVLCASVSLW